MKTSMERWDLLGIASLLQSSPYVETLVLDVISSYNVELEVCFSLSNFLNVVWYQRKFNEDLILIINFILFNVSIKEVIKVIILDRIKGNANECL